MRPKLVKGDAAVRIPVKPHAAGVALLEGAVETFIQGAGKVSSALLGMINRVGGQIYALLFLNDEPLSLTAGSDHPDGIVQLLQLFRSRRTGDIVLSTRDDVVLGRDPSVSGGATHGSLARRHLEVPFLTSVPLALVTATIEPK